MYYKYLKLSYLIICGLWDVNRKWSHISGLPGSSKQVHEVIIKVPYGGSSHRITKLN